MGAFRQAGEALLPFFALCVLDFELVCRLFERVEDETTMEIFARSSESQVLRGVREAFEQEGSSVMHKVSSKSVASRRS